MIIRIDQMIYYTIFREYDFKFITSKRKPKNEGVWRDHLAIIKYEPFLSEFLMIESFDGPKGLEKKLETGDIFFRDSAQSLFNLMKEIVKNELVVIDFQQTIRSFVQFELPKEVKVPT